MTKLLQVIGVALLAAISLQLPAHASTILGGGFSDRMVLQRDTALIIWGQDDPGRNVRVQFKNNASEAIADGNGRWQVKFPPQDAGGPYQLIAEGSSRAVISDVLVGDIWLCSGQSNMEMTLNSAENGKDEAQNFETKQIRLLRVPRAFSIVSSTQSYSRWQAANSKTVGWFSAVCSLFGRELQKELRIPIGLIDASVSGSPIEAWINDPDIVLGFPIDPATQSYLDRAKRFSPDRLDEVKIDEIGPGPRAFPPASLWRGMIERIRSLPIRGVVWYQGEGNANRPDTYRRLLASLIEGWRQQWSSKLPVLIVQLPGIGQKIDQMKDGGWPRIREAQAQVAESLPLVSLVNSIDLGDTDLHPRKKAPVAHRLARTALANVYGPGKEPLGPSVSNVDFVNRAAILTYKNKSARNQLAKCGDRLLGFSVAGADGIWRSANAEISGMNKVTARSELVSRPVAVRYAWAPNPEATLCDGDGDPALPFRSDRSSN